MTTPQLQVQAVQAVLYHNSPGQLLINTFDAAGNVLNVSSGYDLTSFLLNPQGANPDFITGADVKANSTVTWGTTGFTIKWTAAQAATLGGKFPLTNMTGGILISNDSDVTSALAAVASIQYSNAGQTI